MELNEILERLGLEDPHAYTARAMRKSTYPRASGRTTRMLLNAILHIQANAPAIIVAAYPYHAKQLRQQLAVMLGTLGLDVGESLKLVEFISIGEAKERVHGNRIGASSWLYDHYAIESDSYTYSPYRKYSDEIANYVPKQKESNENEV